MRDSSAPPDPLALLSGDAVETMRRAMISCLDEPGDPTAVRHAIRCIAVEAQLHQLRAEHLIIALKHVWHSVPEMQRAATRQERDRLLDRLITVCIEEYYGD